MPTRLSFQDLFQLHMEEGRHVCVGLDSELSRIPRAVGGTPTDPSRMQVFNARIVSETWELTAAYKLNLSFYQAHGPAGLEALRQTVQTIREYAPHAIVILDAKYGDIGNSNRGYVQFAFDWLGADAVTVVPYMGGESLAPFLERSDKGIFILCRTSNPGAREFQDLKIFTVRTLHGAVPLQLYERVATNIATHWNRYGNCALVVGATAPAGLAEVRSTAPDLPILIPGVGRQGGSLEASIAAAQSNFLVNSSRGVIFASDGQDFAEAARREVKKLFMGITGAMRKGAV